MLPYLTFTQPTYSDKINHIRAVGAFWIFVFHYYHFIIHPFFAPLESLNPFLLLVYHGYFFVYLFFVLSGFLLAKAYVNKLDLKPFFTKRIGRIFPAYYLCLAVYWVLFAYGSQDFNLLVAVFSFDLEVYPSAIGHLWFINRLLECYLCFPLLWWGLQKTGKAGLLIVYMLCLLGGGYWVVLVKAALPLYYGSLVLCLSHFILGILVAHQPVKSKQLTHSIIALIIFGILLECFHQSNWQTPLAYSWFSILWFNYIAVLFAVLISAYLSRPIYMPQFTSIMMQKLGHISYNFYLYHFLVIHFFIEHRELLTTNSSVNFMSLLTICIVSAIFFQLLLAMLIGGISTIKSRLLTARP